MRARRVAAKARFQARVAAKRRDVCHKLTRDLVGRYGRIAIEDLNIKALAKGMHAKHVLRKPALSATSSRRRRSRPQSTAANAVALSTETLLLRWLCISGAFGFWPGTGHGQVSEPVAAEL